MKDHDELSAKLASALIAGVALVAPSLSNSSMVFTITRVCDSEAQIAGTSALDAPIGSSFLPFSGTTSTGDNGQDPFTGSMSIGGVGVEYVCARSGGNELRAGLFPRQCRLAERSLASCS